MFDRNYVFILLTSNSHGRVLEGVIPPKYIQRPWRLGRITLKMKVPILILILLLPLSSAWTDTNLRLMSEKAYSMRECDQEFAELWDSRINQTPTWDLFLELYNKTDCKGYGWGAPIYFQLNDPRICERFYTRITDWWDYSDWRFVDCGIVYTKADLDAFIEGYATGYWSKTLQMPQKPVSHNLTQTHTEPEIIAPEPLLGGGMSGVGHAVFQTWIFLPNWAWVELLLLIVCFRVAMGFSEDNLWVESYGQKEGGYASNKVVSWVKMMKYGTIMFVIFSLVFWVVVLLVLTAG